MNKKIGRQTVVFNEPVYITSVASIVGPKEGEGPLSKYFDTILTDMFVNQNSWEKAEIEIVKRCSKLAIKKANLINEQIDYIIAGDLLNQNIASTFAFREFEIPFIGVFSACSTFAESLSIGSMLIDGNCATNILIEASSHFCSAEKQFRYPLQLGVQRPPSSTWTVTGSGAVVISKNKNNSTTCVTSITTGKIVDMGVVDSSNMGSAMAPAAFDTIKAHLKETNRLPSYYDIIVTGDLGYIGNEILIKLMNDEGIVFGENYEDCGIEIFDKETQDTHSGGSGCACCAVSFSYYYKKLQNKEINKILYLPTGALMNTTSSFQGESIPSIAHAIAIENM